MGMGITGAQGTERRAGSQQSQGAAANPITSEAQEIGEIVKLLQPASSDRIPFAGPFYALEYLQQNRDKLTAGALKLLGDVEAFINSPSASVAQASASLLAEAQAVLQNVSAAVGASTREFLIKALNFGEKVNEFERTFEQGAFQTLTGFGANIFSSLGAAFRPSDPGSMLEVLNPSSPFNQAKDALNKKFWSFSTGGTPYDFYENASKYGWAPWAGKYAGIIDANAALLLAGGVTTKAVNATALAEEGALSAGGKAAAEAPEIAAAASSKVTTGAAPEVISSAGADAAPAIEGFSETKALASELQTLRDKISNGTLSDVFEKLLALRDNIRTQLYLSTEGTEIHWRLQALYSNLCNVAQNFGSESFHGFAMERLDLALALIKKLPDAAETAEVGAIEVTEAGAPVLELTLDRATEKGMRGLMGDLEDAALGRDELTLSNMESWLQRLDQILKELNVNPFFKNYAPQTVDHLNGAAAYLRNAIELVKNGQPLPLPPSEAPSGILVGGHPIFQFLSNASKDLLWLLRFLRHG